jgi:hypothetical protein
MGERTDEVGEKTPEEIRGDIEKTRAEMGETIAAIEDRVSPEKMKETVREETIGRARAAADQTTARVKETGFRLIGRAQPALEQARSQAKPLAEKAQDNLRRGQAQFRQLQDENPVLAYGLVAGISAAITVLIWPASRRD